MAKSLAPFRVYISRASITHHATGSTLTISADTDDGPKKLEIALADDDPERALRGKSALYYLLDEIGLYEFKTCREMQEKRLARWAWDRVVAIAQEPITGQFVYVISCQGSAEPLTKIGITNSPERRLVQLSTGSPYALRIDLAQLTHDAGAVERAAHLHFGNHRRNGEWFAIPASKAIEFIMNETRGHA